MIKQLEASAVRIYTANQEVVGAGFLVSQEYVLTCAHVVAEALDLDEDISEVLDARVQLDFPIIAPNQILMARVVFWQPPLPNGSGDIAGLQLDGGLPPDASAVRLVFVDEVVDHDFRAFGFPQGHDNGLWASGQLQGRQASGWVQIEGVTETGARVQQGFSGGAVWDKQLDGVVGMVVAEVTEPSDKIAFMIPTQVIVEAWPILHQQTIPPCPYRGLLAFEQKHASFFFGRETFTKQLVGEVPKKPLIAVIGVSGSGKSSVVKAGLFPRLSQEGGWLIASFHPGEDAFSALAASLIPLLEPTMSEADRLVEQGKLARYLQTGEVRLHGLLARIVTKHTATHLLLLADQFEELYTLRRQTELEEREHFIQQFTDQLLTLVQAEPSPLSVHLLITLRADFIGRALSYRPFLDALQHNDLKLGPMTRKELDDAIRKPAKKLHVEIEAGLVERILDEVGQEPGKLPLLEFALTQLWERQYEGRLTHAAYDEIRGVEGALTTYADGVYETFSKEEQQRVRQVFEQLVRPGEATEDTSRRATRDEIGEDRWNVVAQLADRRLVVSGQVEATGEEAVEIVHEALIKGWKSLHDWMEDDRAFRLWQERLRVMRSQWDTSQKEKSALLRGALLADAAQWMAQRPDAINTAEKKFIQASIAEKQQQEADELARRTQELQLQHELQLLREEERQHELERQLQQEEERQHELQLQLERAGKKELELRRQRQRNRLSLALAGVIIVALLIGIVALQQRAFVSRLSAITVMNLQDSGKGSLRQAIADAHPGQTITFFNDLQGKITLTSGEIVITKDVSIIGNGEDVLTLSGDKSRVLHVQKGVTAAIFGLTIKDGSAQGSGGGIAIENGATLTLDSSKVLDNRSSLYGGGIDNAGVLTLTNSIISGNTSAEGGGLTNFGTAILSNSKVLGNKGLAGSGGLENYGTLRLTNSTVTGNTAKGGGIANPTPCIGGYMPKCEKDYGGGIYNEGPLTLTNSTVSYNIADKDGGGIENTFSGNVTIQFSTIAWNSASGNGGGIANRDNGAITLEYSAVSNNTAINGGGIFMARSIFTNTTTTIALLNTTVAENTATQVGGAIDVMSGQASIVYGTIALNNANVGGGIAISLGTSLALQSSIVAGNSAAVGSNIAGTLTTNGYNLIQNASSITLKDPFNVHSTDLSGGTLTDLKIDSVLKDNDGPTKTLALLQGSPAIDRIPPGNLCGQGSRYNILGRDQDQRGVDRPQPKDGACDIGAYEYQSS